MIAKIDGVNDYFVKPIEGHSDLKLITINDESIAGWTTTAVNFSEENYSEDWLFGTGSWSTLVATVGMKLAVEIFDEYQSQWPHNSFIEDQEVTIK